MDSQLSQQATQINKGDKFPNKKQLYLEYLEAYAYVSTSPDTLSAIILRSAKNNHALK